MPPTNPFPNQALALLPRSLRLSPSTQITRSHLLALYKEELRVAHSFQSYNFRHYFIRRTREKFRTELPALLDGAFSQSGEASTSTSSLSASASSSPASTSKLTAASTESSDPSDSSIYAPTSTPSSIAAAEEATSSLPEARLREWYRDSLVELGVMARSAAVNRMYEAPKLVVEGVTSHLAVAGGGGAGAEAGYGGGGQPGDGQPDIPATPAGN